MSIIIPGQLWLGGVNELRDALNERIDEIDAELGVVSTEPPPPKNSKVRSVSIVHCIDASSLKTEVHDNPRLMRFLKEEGIKTFHLDLQDVDESEETMFKNLVATSQFIQARIDAGDLVMVHCRMGISRSSTVVIAYLMSRPEYRMDCIQAAEHARATRPFIFPNDGFINCLVEHELGSAAYRERMKEKEEKEKADALAQGKDAPPTGAAGSDYVSRYNSRVIELKKLLRSAVLRKKGEGTSQFPIDEEHVVVHWCPPVGRLGVEDYFQTLGGLPSGVSGTAASLSQFTSVEAALAVHRQSLDPSFDPCPEYNDGTESASHSTNHATDGGASGSTATDMKLLTTQQRLEAELAERKLDFPDDEDDDAWLERHDRDQLEQNSVSST